MFTRSVLLLLVLSLSIFVFPTTTLADPPPGAEYGARPAGAANYGEDVTGPVSWGFGAGGAKDANGNSVYLDDNNVWQRTERPWKIVHPVPAGTDYITPPAGQTKFALTDRNTDVQHFGYFFGDIFRGSYPKPQTGRDVQDNDRRADGRGKELSRRFATESVSNPKEAAENMSNSLGEKVVPADRN